MVFGAVSLWGFFLLSGDYFFFFCNIFVNDQLVAKFKSSRFEFIYNQVQKN